MANLSLVKRNKRLFLHVTKTNISNLQYYNFIQVATVISCIMLKDEQECQRLVTFDENKILYINRIKKKDHSVICYMTF